MLPETGQLGAAEEGLSQIFKGVIKTETSGAVHVNANNFIHFDRPTSSANQVPRFDGGKRMKGGISASLYNCKSGEIVGDGFLFLDF